MAKVEKTEYGNQKERQRHNSENDLVRKLEALKTRACLNLVSLNFEGRKVKIVVFFR